jgi:hypothetical protein
MGVLTDYFRAADGATVEQAMRADTTSPMRREPGFDGVAFRELDEVVVLGRLLAAITGVEWASGLTESVPIYPPAATEPKDGDWAGLADDSPWVTGPWVTELGEGTRHALASLDPASIPAVAAGWAAAEEFDGQLNPAAAEQIIADLQGLARRAEEAGERLYCWTCL